MNFLGLIRAWRELAVGALLVALAVLWAGRAMTERQNEKLKAALREANATIEREREAVTDRVAQAKAEDAAHAARVERDQNHVSMETSDAYQQQVADLRRRYDALRLRSGTSEADRAGRSAAGVPKVSDTARIADGSAGEDGLSSIDALIASEQSVRLQALQQWVSGQETVER